VCVCVSSGNEYTHVYGGTKDQGNYTPCIADCFSPHVTSCVLDGEMVGFNADTKTIGTDFTGFLFSLQYLLLGYLTDDEI